MDAKLVSPTEVEITGSRTLAEWREARAFFTPGHQYASRFKSGQWDGKRWPGRMTQSGGRVVLHGSIGLGLRAAKDLGFPFPWAATDIDISAYISANSVFGKFRDYQLEAFTEALLRGWGRVSLATNAGKGAVIATLARWARDQGLSVLVLADELAVYDALQGELRTWAGLQQGRSLHLVKSGVKGIPPVPSAALAMVPTLARRLKDDYEGDRWKAWLGEQDMVLLDEADKATSDSWKLILKAAKKSRWRVGFSGTFSTDPFTEMLIDELMGPELVRAKNIDMITLGVSAKPTIQLIRYDVTDHLFHVQFPNRRWAGTEMREVAFSAGLFNNVMRHAYIAALVRPNTPTAIIVNRIEHGQALLEHVRDAVFLDGSSAEYKRHRELSAFDSGDTNVLVVTRILDRGTNRLGRACDLIFAGGEGSERQILQRIGRGLRRADGKEFLRVVDVMDVVNEERLADVIGSKKATRLAKYFNDAVQRRLSTYNAEGFEVEILT